MPCLRAPLTLASGAVSDAGLRLWSRTQQRRLQRRYIGEGLASLPIMVLAGALTLLLLIASMLFAAQRTTTIPAQPGSGVLSRRRFPIRMGTPQPERDAALVSQAGQFSIS